MNHLFNYLSDYASLTGARYKEVFHYRNVGEHFLVEVGSYGFYYLEDIVFEIRLNDKVVYRTFIDIGDDYRCYALAYDLFQGDLDQEIEENLALGGVK